MKTIILAIILAISLCTTAYILNRNFHGNVLIERIAKAEIKIAVLQDRFERDQHHAQRVIDEVKCIVQEGYAPYSHVIPIKGGFLGIKTKGENDEIGLCSRIFGSIHR